MTARPPARSGSDSARRDRVRDLLAPVVQGLHLELEDVELRSVGRRLVLRVLVDNASGVSLDDVASAAHAVSEALDASDVLGDEPYTLEVSSPGVDRPLTLPRHWQRSVARLVAVTLADGATLTGRVLAVSEDTVELEVAVKGRTSRVVLALADVRRAVVEVEFSRKDAPAADEADDDADDANDDDADDEDDADDATDDEHDGTV
jgi:ribosome maturation factor RimP